jgi:ubiquinone biosynthesis protein UbiJ
MKAPSTPFTLSRLVARAIEKILLADPDYRHSVPTLLGSLRLTLPEWGVSVIFLPEDSELKILPFSKEMPAPTVSLSGRMADFIGLFSRESSSVVRSHVEIQGNVRVLSQYQSFFKQWKVDLGHVLASTLGEGPARVLFNPLKKLSEFLQHQREERQQDVKETLHEEYRLLVPKTELEEFYADIKTLQLRVDRLGRSFHDLQPKILS